MVAALITLIVCALIVLFLGTRLGISIRATGDNPDMVRASSINTATMITIGLCLANAMTSLSGAVLAQYNKSADINLGTGMVVIGLVGWSLNALARIFERRMQRLYGIEPR